MPSRVDRLAADGHDDLQVGRVDPESQFARQVPRLQIEIQHVQLEVPALENKLAVADAEVVDGEGRTQRRATGHAFQQAVVEDENRLLDLDADRLFFHEQRSRRQINVDRGERDQVFVLDREILDVADLHAQGEQGEPQVAKADIDPAAGNDQVEDVIFGGVINAAADQKYKKKLMKILSFFFIRQCFTFSQSFKKRSMPLLVRGWLSSCASVANGMVATSAPILAAWTKCSGWRTEATMISVLIP